MKSKKFIGICLIVVVFLGLAAWGAVNYLKCAELQKISDETNCTEHEATIDRLQNELAQFKNAAQGNENNTEDILAERAAFFLETFYESSNQKKSVRPLMTDAAFKKLYQEVNDNGDGIGTNENYQTEIKDVRVYYKKTDSANADVMVLAKLNVQTPAGNTTTQLLFHAAMTWQGEAWLVSEILQNSTIKFMQ